MDSPTHDLKGLFDQLGLDSSEKAIDDVYAHMDDHGVSIDMVYQLERIRSLLRRLGVLLRPFQTEVFTPNEIQTLMSLLILENLRSRSLRALIDDNTALISKKITENSAETGEHYIARTKADYYELFKSSLGGGAVTAITTLLKFVISALPGSPFWSGFLASMNYSISFVALQTQHFTLATKQPAMTAAALSRNLEADKESFDLNPVVLEIFHIIRSQFLSVLGNLTAVIPSVVIICYFYSLLSGHPLLNTEKALYMAESISIVGPTLFYAAFTGVLLFVSSLFSGWFHHWVLYRQLPQALAKNPTLISWVGPEKARLYSQKFKRNAAGLASSISLGFLLGLTPVLASFFGLPLDVRHVTLSTGGLTAAMMTLGFSSVTYTLFWTAVLGILSMAILNVFVSFILALFVALRAKKISFQMSLQLLGEIFAELKKRTWKTFSFRSK